MNPKELEQPISELIGDIITGIEHVTLMWLAMFIRENKITKQQFIDGMRIVREPNKETKTIDMTYIYNDMPVLKTGFKEIGGERRFIFDYLADKNSGEC